MDTPYGIFEYTPNNFCAYISYQTETPFISIKRKPQITYLHNYLSGYQKRFGEGKKIYFVYENEYIDKHYLEDYSQYYVSCFKPYKKYCSRIHFFLFEENEENVSQEKKKLLMRKMISTHFKPKKNELWYKEELNKALKNEPSFITSENYLGFMVVRPIPETFLAKMCLRPFYESYDRREKHIILKKTKVSLFGINLRINSVAFQEQDKILSACATTAIWSFLHGHPYKSKLTLPSSSAITKSAYPDNNGYSREFPNAGLTADMIRRSLKAYDLTPEYFEFAPGDDINLLKELIYAYSSSKLPLILGVKVGDYCSEGTCELIEEGKGLHAVTIVGYSMEQQAGYSPLVAHNLECLYVHDDRYGPFMRIAFNKSGSFDVILIKNEEVTTVPNYTNETYYPKSLVAGLYHKIRIPYIKIKNTCIDLQEMLCTYLKEFGEDEYAEVIMSLQWDIQIKKVQYLKGEILERKIVDKANYLTKSWPKYMWSATACLGEDSIFEMIFDATDIDHGDVFLDILPMNDDATNEIVSLLQIYSDNRYIDKIRSEKSTTSRSDYIWGIIKHYRHKNTCMNTLTSLFGHLKIPKKIKKEELNKDFIIDQREARISRLEEVNEFSFDKDIEKQGFTYIWVIDQEGYLCIGKEKKGSDIGHPTLTDGMPARIGGNIKYNLSNYIWEVDPFSGRYSEEYSYEDKVSYTDNAIQYKFIPFFPDLNFKAKDFAPR